MVMVSLEIETIKEACIISSKELMRCVYVCMHVCVYHGVGILG